MKTQEEKERDRMFLKLFLKGSATEVSDDEVDYFRKYPDQIDEVTAPVQVHKLFLWAGSLIGVVCVAASKVLKFSQFVLFSEGVREFTVDIIFEVGVALIGAAVTAYILGILLNQQQDNAAKWQAEIRRRISHPDSQDGQDSDGWTPHRNIEQPTNRRK